MSKEKKELRLVIRCKKETKKLFKRYVADSGASSYEEALLQLLNLAGYYPVGRFEAKR